MTDAQIITVLHLAVALLMVGLGWPLWREKIGPNPWYGFRTPATLADERVWYPVNRSTGGRLMLVGLATLPVVLATWYFGLSTDVAALVNLIPIAIGLAALVVRGLRLARRLQGNAHS